MGWSRRAEARVLCLILGLTGFTALALQVLWQRVIAVHAGADTAATAVVVAGFLGGLCIGNVLGGRIAERTSAARALRVFAAAEAGVAVIAVVSTWLFYDLYSSVAPAIAGTVWSVLLNLVVLAVPTTLMGLSMPIASSVIAGGRSDSASGDVGRLYAANTMGGAVGALLSGWYLLGRVGFVGTAWICAALGLASAASLVVLSSSLAPRAVEPSAVRDAPEQPSDSDPAPPLPTGRAWPWYLGYGVSGALALGLQQAYFRLAGAIGRSNSYSFATVLAMYLAVFAVGAALAAAAVRRVRNPRRVVFWLQFGVGLSAIVPLIVLVDVLPGSPLGDRLLAWFNSDGFASGYDAAGVVDVAVFAIGLPALILAPSVFLMGATFPFIERVVVGAAHDVGERTGRLLAANTVGNVIGVFVTAYVLFDVVGTAGTVITISALLMAAGLLAAATYQGRRRVLAGCSVVILAVVTLSLAPSNHSVWAQLSGDVDGSSTRLEEDASCAAVMKDQGSGAHQLSLNGASQNGYPYDDFHVLIGLLPSLASAEPGRGLAIGHGIGSTSYSMLTDAERSSVTTVELCGGTYPLADELADAGVHEFLALRDDPRHRRVVGDGRQYLLRSDERFDAIVVDTLRITSPNSGQHFSRGFYELVDSRLTDDGVLAQWVPTWRTLNSAAQVFPYVVTGTVEEYGDSVLMLAGREPIDVQQLAARMDERVDVAAFESAQRERIEDFISSWTPTCITDGVVATDVPAHLQNDDLFPRDEYHRNNGFIGEESVVRTC